MLTTFQISSGESSHASNYAIEFHSGVAANVISQFSEAQKQAKAVFTTQKELLETLEQMNEHWITRPQASARRGSRVGEQDGSCSLGHHEQTRHLPTRSSSSMTCWAAACRKLARVKHVMAQSVTRRLERSLTASAGF
jgi:hypothetical protein